MPQPAACVFDMHTCPLCEGTIPHVGGPILVPGCLTVLIGGMPAARVDDMAECVGWPEPDTILRGSLTVSIGGKPAARMADSTAHGGTIITGFDSVLIGD